MAVLDIVTFPAAVLRERTQPVTEFGKDLEKLAKDMLDTMYDAPGVGLAANQVGVSKRLFVLDVDYKIDGDEDDVNSRTYSNQSPLIIVNPEVKNSEGKMLYREGCLSVPGVSEEVSRKAKLTLAYQDLAGKSQVLQAEGLLCVAIQHEIDHLDGKLFIDRLSQVKKQLIKGKMKKERNKGFERSRFHVDL